MASWTFHFFAFLTFVTHTRAAFTDPGECDGKEGGPLSGCGFITGYVSKKNLKIDFPLKQEETKREERKTKKKRKKKDEVKL